MSSTPAPGDASFERLRLRSGTDQRRHLAVAACPQSAGGHGGGGGGSTRGGEDDDRSAPHRRAEAAGTGDDHLPLPRGPVRVDVDNGTELSMILGAWVGEQLRLRRLREESLDHTVKVLCSRTGAR